MINNIFKTTLILIALLNVASCGPSTNASLVRICQSNPELCSDLHKINACSYKRSSLIRARYYDKTSASDNNTMKLLDELSTYESCLNLTLAMEYSKNKNRKEKMIENSFTTNKLMQDRLNTLKGTENPHIAYYLWTHYQDFDAKRIFLNAATKKDTADVDLLVKLARFYAKKHPQEALKLFYSALNKSQSLDDIPKNTFTFIMTIFYQKKDFEHAYIWAVLAQKENTEKGHPINLALILQKGLINREKLISNEDELDKQAASYYDQLKQGTFSMQAPQLPPEEQI